MGMGTWIFFWGCTEHSSTGIEQHTLDEPDSEPTIIESNYTDTTDFEYDNTYTYRIRAYNNYSGTVFTDFSNETSVTLSE